MSSLIGAAVRAASSAAVVVGVCGDPAADEDVLSTVRDCGVPLSMPESGAAAPPTATRLVSVADGDEEVRQVVREVIRLAADGMPLDRIAIYRPSPVAYARTLLEQLDGAGIPHNGPAAKRLADTVAGRTLLQALALPREAWGRAALIALIAEAPVRAEGKLASPRHWDAVSRRAGVVGGLDDWRSKLAAHADVLAAVVADAVDDDPPDVRYRARLAERDLETARRMAAFVDELAARLAAVDAVASWTERCEAARSLLHGLLGHEQRRVQWPDLEVAAAQRVDEALIRLGRPRRARGGAEPDDVRAGGRGRARRARRPGRPVRIRRAGGAPGHVGRFRRRRRVRARDGRGHGAGAAARRGPAARQRSAPWPWRASC